jgi:hypothetical protein
MPRTARASLGNWCYHVLNRGNARAEVFHKPDDYAAFVGLFAPACERISPNRRFLGRLEAYPTESTRHLGRSAILYNRVTRGGAPRGSLGGGTLFSNSVVDGGGGIAKSPVRKTLTPALSQRGEGAGRARCAPEGEGIQFSVFSFQFSDEGGSWPRGFEKSL